MGKIYVVIGKSASGKDTIYKKLLEDEELGLKKITTYTTRPIRVGEIDGLEYYFVQEGTLKKQEEKGNIIEQRCYNTIHGAWYYFMVDDGQINLNKADYIVIDTLEGYEQIRNYYGEDFVVPIYIEVEDGIRLSRALKREMQQKEPKYAELCRRFLADDKDFSKENLEHLNIGSTYINNAIEECFEKIKGDIKEIQQKIQ